MYIKSFMRNTTFKLVVRLRLLHLYDLLVKKKMFHVFFSSVFVLTLVKVVKLSSFSYSTHVLRLSTNRLMSEKRDEEIDDKSSTFVDGNLTK